MVARELKHDEKIRQISYVGTEVIFNGISDKSLRTLPKKKLRNHRLSIMT